MSQSNFSFDRVQNDAAVFADCISNSKRIFQLIDSFVPVEFCLRHQVLPLDLKNKNLSIGMIDPEDSKTLNSLNSIVGSFGYGLTVKSIDIQTHQLIIENYLQCPNPGSKRDPMKQTIIDESVAPINNNRRRRLDSAPTIISIPEETPSFKKEDASATLIDLPPDLDLIKEQALANNSLSSSGVDATMTLTDIPPDFLESKTERIDQHERLTLITEEPEELDSSDKIATHHLLVHSGETQISPLIRETQSTSEGAKVEDFFVSDIPAQNQEGPTDFLASSSDQLSWQRLLEASLEREVEQLHFKRYSTEGSIVAINNRITVSSLDRIEVSSFCSTINEIKTMTKLSLVPLKSPQKFVLEKFHNQERVLLRIEFIPNQYGEEVMVQILRNKALEFYEQKQMDKMSEQAFLLAKKLEETVRKMRVCFDSAIPSNIKELQAVQQEIDRQLKLLNK